VQRVRTVEEGGRTRTFTVTLEAVGDGAGGGGGAVGGTADRRAAEPAPVREAGDGGGGGTPVHSTFAGSVEVVAVRVREGQRIEEGAVVAVVEAMKATHDIRSPVAGVVRTVHVAAGDDVDAKTPIVTIG
jgi:biotin carboxyl carrier protein